MKARQGFLLGRGWMLLSGKTYGGAYELEAMGGSLPNGEEGYGFGLRMSLYRTINNIFVPFFPHIRKPDIGPHISFPPTCLILEADHRALP